MEKKESGKQLQELTKDIKGFLSYLEQNRLLLICVGFFTLLAYGGKLFHQDILMDTAVLACDPDSLLTQWISIGRFGLVVTKKIFGLVPYCDYIAAFLMVCGIYFFSLVWSYILTVAATGRHGKSITSCIFPVIFLTSPLFAEQFVYMLQSCEIAFLMAVCAVSVGAITKWICKPDCWIYLVLGMVCMVWNMASYQAFINIYISAVLAVYILLYVGHVRGTRQYDRKFFRMAVVKYLVTFVSGFAVYFVLNKIIRKIYCATTYLDEKILWRSEDVKTCIANIKNYIKLAILGEDIFYSKWFLVMVVMAVVCIAFVVVKYKKSNTLLFLMAFVALVISPFLLSVYLGDALSPRMQFSYQFTTAFLLYFMVWLVDRQWIRYAGVMIAFVIAFQQGCVTARLFALENRKYEQDLNMAYKIETRVENLGYGEVPEYPVVFVGNHGPYAATAVNESVIGISWFQYGGQGQLATYLFQYLGYPYIFPTEEESEKAAELAGKMECWPDEDSVKYQDGLIIVKLNDVQ